MLTGLGDGHHVRDIRHKDPAFKLQLRVLGARLWPRGPGLVLLVLALPWRDLLATEKNALEKINLVLDAKRVSTFYQVSTSRTGEPTSFS